MPYLKKLVSLLSAFFILTLNITTTSWARETPLSISEIGADALQETAGYVRRQDLNYFTHEELKYISKNPTPSGELEQKLKNFWRSTLISNEAYYRGVKPHRPKSLQLGEFLRAITWNIEKSLNIPAAIGTFTESKETFNHRIDSSKVQVGSEDYEFIMRQRERLKHADIVVLQEMEIGVKRSDYRNAAEEIAKALDMNFAYAPQYLEVDPVTLGTEKIEMEDGSEDFEAEEYYRVDPEKYKGVFGSAVLSRYPIKHVEVRPLDHQAYDWYEGEKEKVTFLESARRLGTKTLFLNELTREIKVGGRHYFRVDLDVPGVENNTVSVINIHLEIKCKPKEREKQIKEILGYIKGIKNPVIMLGDFNAAPTDISPTSAWKIAKNTATNPSALLGLGLQVAGSSLNTPRVATNIVKNFNDPFAADIKVVAPNPLKDMFELIRDFRFEDKRVFDFRGNSNRSIGNKSGILANSNERGLKGFKTSFSVKRALSVIGKYRLDWVFVKSNLYQPEDEKGSYVFAPHFGETLEELNTSLVYPVSDHHPSVVDIPFGEPKV